mmetsp:Transcript_1551/g.3959  ORF Transcript_1551/g.3959 Transcript_1551/m.3959 type:complete len:353 (+) Transcript_1551:115-1173(+)
MLGRLALQAPRRKGSLATEPASPSGQPANRSQRSHRARRLHAGLSGIDLLAAAIGAALVLQELQLPCLLMEEVSTTSTARNRYLGDHRAVEADWKQRRELAEVHDEDFFGPQLQQRLPVNADRLVRLARDVVAGRVKHLLHKEVLTALVAAHRALVQGHDLGPTPCALVPTVVVLPLGAGVSGDELQRVLGGDVGLWLELDQRENVEAQEGPDEGVPAVDAAVEVGAEQRVRGHAPVADGKQLVLVTVCLGADGEARQVNLVLPRRRHAEDLQLIVGHARQLVGPQALGLLGQRIQGVDPGNAERHLPQQMAPRIGLGTIANHTGASPRIISLVVFLVGLEQHGGRLPPVGA